VRENLSLLETEVEGARTKLAEDLALLRSPRTYRKFADDIRFEAQSVARRVVDDIKSRAAANPTAALAIGAGIGWRLLKHPPIATALIGLGVLSLWRTEPSPADPENYLSTAKRRFGEQLGEAAESAKEYVAETAATARDKVGVIAQSALDATEKLAASAGEQAAENLNDAMEATADFSNRAVNNVQRKVSTTMRDEDLRNQLLLGVAGAAVMAALSIAYQRQQR
jgi:hypothetical protein